MASPAIRRLQQDLKRLKEEPLVGAMAQPANDKNLMVWHGIVVGTEGTPLVGIPIRFCMEFPNDYPNAPPNAYFQTYIAYKNGAQVKDNKGRIAVCLSIFGNFAHIHTEWKDGAAGWSPAYTVSTILVSLQALVMGNMFSDKPSDVERMISSALQYKCEDTGHDGSDSSKWFPQVITDPDVAAEITNNYLKINPQANSPLERFYICYANGMLNANNSTIGYGVQVENPRNGILTSPCEYLSNESFANGGVRKSSLNKSFQFWLPILTRIEDWTGPKNIKSQFLASVNIICTEINFIQEEHKKVFKVCSSLMNSLVVEIMRNAGNATANDKFINGYFAIFRLLHQYAQGNKELISYSNSSLKTFKTNPEARVKASAPNLGEFLMHLTISTEINWNDISDVFMGETTVSRNLVMFQIKFANVTNFLDFAEFNSNFGLAPESLTAELKNLYSQVVAVKNWNEFYDFVQMPKVDDEKREVELVEAVKKSAAQGYHRSGQQNAVRRRYY